GAVGNVLCIKTFFRLGISDGVNLSLLSLAASDLFYLISALINTISFMLHSAEELSLYTVWFPVDPEAIFLVFASTGSSFYAISMLVTTFITVVRCLAVVQPLKYRNLISRQTTAIIISIFTLVSITSAILVVALAGIPPPIDSNSNTTRPTLLFFPERVLMKDIIYGTRDIILPLASQIIVGLCVVIMARYLRKASIFRHKHSRNTAMNTQKSISMIGNLVRRNVKTVTDPESAKVVGKELQVVQQMLLIAVVYSLCNMPKVVFNMTLISVPDFYSGGRYSAVYFTSNIIRELIQSVNASVDIFIYWKYNSKFRSHFIRPK
ncbi:unnamed protein product, partial [Lymnaea stagnalis]